MECTHRHTCHTHMIVFSPYHTAQLIHLFSGTRHSISILSYMRYYSTVYTCICTYCTVYIYAYARSYCIAGLSYYKLCYASFWAHAVFCSYGKIFFAKVLEPPYKGTIYNMGRPHRSNYIVSKLGHSSIIESD